jgi:hypothetical protein
MFLLQCGDIIATMSTSVICSTDVQIFCVPIASSLGTFARCMLIDFEFHICTFYYIPSKNKYLQYFCTTLSVVMEKSLDLTIFDYPPELVSFSGDRHNHFSRP